MIATNVFGQHKNLRGGVANKMGECRAGVRRWQKITNIQVWLTFRHNIEMQHSCVMTSDRCVIPSLSDIYIKSTIAK